MAEELEDFDWDADDFDPDKGFVNKDEWKDEDEELKKTLQDEPPATGTKPNAESVPKKSKQERIEEKKAQRRAEKLSAEDEQKTSLTAEEQAAEKQRLRQVQEEADLEVTKDLFGVSGASNTIDGMNPKTQEDFDTFREAVKNKFKTLEVSPMYVGFLESLIRDLAVSLDTEDVRRLSNSLSHVANEKQKATKSTKSKKKGGVKVSLAVGKASKKSIVDHDDFNDMGAEFDDFM